MINRVIGGLLLIIFIAFYFLIPSQVSDAGVPTNSPLAIYPSFFPKILAVFGCMLSLFLILTTSSISRQLSKNDIQIPTKSNLFRIFSVMLIISIYLLTFNFLGYLISTSISLVFLMAFLGLRDIKYYIISVIILPSAIYFLFKKILYVPLPTGIFGF